MRALVLLAILWGQPLFAKRHALVVGINTYAKGPCVARPQMHERGFELTGACPLNRQPDLRNAVPDARTYERLLRDRYRFTDDELTVRINQQATALEIKRLLREMLLKKGLQAGDEALFYFAGHGTQVKWGGKTVEALVPYDFLLGTYPLLDLEMGALYQEALGKRIRLTVVFDTCYSGGMSRGDPTEGLRSMNDPRELAMTRLKPFVPGEGFAMLGAAQGSQTASDGPQTFTRAMVDLVQGLPWELSVNEVAQLLEPRMGGRQIPAPVGEAVNVAGRAVSQSPEEYLVLRLRKGGAVIAGGRVNGMTNGSVLSGHRVVAVRDLESDLDGEGLRAGMRVRLEHWQPGGPEAMSVWLPENLPSAEAIEELVACRSNLEPLPGARVRIGWSATGWNVREGEQTRPLVCADLPAEVGVNLPPSRELATELHAAVRPWADMLKPDPQSRFEVMGRVHDGRIQYALAQRPGTRIEGLVPVSRWNYDWYEQDGQPKEDSPPLLDCAKDPVECAVLLARRMQRSRVFLDLQEAAVRTARRMTAGRALPPPFRLELRERRGKICSPVAVKRVKSTGHYCVFLVRSPEHRMGTQRYVEMYSVDGVGLVSDGFISESKLFPDRDTDLMKSTHDLGVDFSSVRHESQQETIFLFISDKPLALEGLMSRAYQQKRSTASNRETMARLPLDFYVSAYTFPVDP